MEKRVPIRVTSEDGLGRFRYCDYVQAEDGAEFIETKDNKGRHRAPLSDLLLQIDNARSQNIA